MRQGLVVFAKNKKRVSAFYRQALGLAAEEEASSHDLLVGPGIEIVVHAIALEIAMHMRLKRPPDLREDGPLKPIFEVADLDAVRAAAEATGGGLQPREAAWQLRGAWVLDGWDPEGNVVQFRQVAA